MAQRFHWSRGRRFNIVPLNEKGYSYGEIKIKISGNVT